MVSSDRQINIIQIREEFEKLEDEFLEITNRIIIHEEKELLEKKDETLKSISQSTQLVFFSVSLVLLSSITAGYYLSVKISKPLVKLENASKMVAEGDFSSSIHPVKGGDEISSLMKHFQDMTQALRSYREHMESIVELKTDELKNVNIQLEKKIEDYEKATREKEELEAQLIHSEKMKAIGTLAGGIAHDFNNILTGLMGYTQLAIMNVDHDDQIKSYLDQVLISANRAADLTRQILAFSRQSVHKNEPVKIADIIDEVVTLLKATLSPKIDITVTIEPECENTVIIADHTMIHQVLMNLATNSIHSMEEMGGTLTLGLGVYRDDENQLPENITASSEKYMKLSISDTGTGIRKEIQEKIFDPYFTTKPQGKGSGLGLSVVHGIVRRHEGHIKLSSEEGGGTTFNIYLPVGQDEVAESEKLRLVGLGGSESILFVDDEQSIVDIQKVLLGKLGYRITSTSSSTHALELFMENPDIFDIAILDLNMPEMTGIELSQKIMQIHPDLPIIICTGFSESPDDSKMQSLGIRNILRKPFVLDEMAEAIRSIFDETQ